MNCSLLVINIFTFLGCWRTKMPKWTPCKEAHRCTMADFTLICNSPCHTADVGNVALRQTCDFNSTPAHCSYRLGCLKLSVQKSQPYTEERWIRKCYRKQGGKKSAVSLQVSTFSIQAIQQKYIFQEVIALGVHKPCRQGSSTRSTGMTVQGRRG